MDAATERRLVRLAVERGLLDWEDLEALVGGIDEPADTVPGFKVPSAAGFEAPSATRGRAPSASGSVPPSAGDSWIAHLVARGRLDAATVERLAAELADETTESEPDTPATGRTWTLAESETSPGAQRPELTGELRFLAGWTRYRIERHLGSGGMGTVFLAHDPHLGRRVALKFLHRDDTGQTERLLREARAQARVEHPHICPVHEVGEVEGRPYIAMQYIEGPSLGELRGQLPTEEVVRLVATVAHAVHAAHRSGLVHRDLKPGNILVTTDEAGVRQPFVVDFGLARDSSDERLTRTGMVSGTPAYISPEQAAGRPADRRSDVYGLGVILYELLAGRPPFADSNPVRTLLRILEEEAPRLRKVAPTVPRELETIVMKAIERNPARRYDSARALAEDLGRWLDGEPIAARPASLPYRLAKRLRKHRVVAAVVVVAVIALVALGGGLLRERLRAGERAELAARFGQRIAKLENDLRLEAMQPQHDTTPSKRLLRRELAAIEAEMERLGDVAVGPGAAALGRGYLALHQVEVARRHLEGAWDAGEHGAEVAAALGQTYGFLYERALVDASQPRQSGPGRVAVREEAERAYRRPALSYLAEATRSGPADPYLRALVAYYERRWDDALAEARVAALGRPWFWEAAQLEAEIARARADIATDEGRNEEALRFYDEAATYYSALLTRVPSEARLQAAECGLRSRRVLVERLVGGADIEGQEVAALAACDRAIAIDPDLADAYVHQATIHLQRGEAQLRRGVDPAEALAEAVTLAERAIALAPSSSAGFKNVAAALRLDANWSLDHGGEPGPDIERAITAARTAVELQPELAANHNGLGTTLLALAAERQRRGGDAEAAIRDAIASFDRAVALNPRFLPSLINLGTAWNEVVEARVARGEDPVTEAKSAIDAFERAAAVSPNQATLENNLGNTWLTLADYQVNAGTDARATLATAARHYARALELRPDYVFGPYNQAYTQRLMAATLADHGEDPAAAIAATDAFLAAAFERIADDADTWLEAGRVREIEARWTATHDGDPRPSLARAVEALERAAAINPTSPAVHIARGRVERLRATTELAAGRDPATALAAGRIAVDRALAIHAEEPEALALRGVLVQLARPGDATASADIAKAVRLNPLLAREYGPAAASSAQPDVSVRR